MKKNQLENKGVPLFVDATRDLPARAGATFDSYFVSSEFEHDGERYAFVWHQQSLFGQLVTAEVQLTTTKGQVSGATTRSPSRWARAPRSPRTSWMCAPPSDP